MSVNRKQTPEERELEKKSLLLDGLEKQLVERELELETLRGGLLSFEKKYQAATLDRYAQLDELRFRIAELRAQQEPDAPASRVARAVAAMAAHMAMPASPGGAWRPRAKRSPPPKKGDSQKEADGAASASGFNPSEELKKLYREVAKAIHPDFADDEQERAHRHAFMTRANEAYEANNPQKLVDILSEWHHSPESVRGEDPAAKLIRAIRKIARCEDRLVEIDAEMGKLEMGGIFGIKLLAEEADKFERDFLDEMTGRLDEEIAGATALLQQMEAQAAKNPRKKPPSADPFGDPFSAPVDSDAATDPPPTSE